MKGLVSNRVATTTKKSTRNQNQPKIKNNQKSKSTKNQNQPKTKINLKSKSRHKRTVGNRESTGPCWLLLAVRESKTFQLLHCTAAAAAVHCSVCSALDRTVLLNLVHCCTCQLCAFQHSATEPIFVQPKTVKHTDLAKYTWVQGRCRDAVITGAMSWMDDDVAKSSDRQTVW